MNVYSYSYWEPVNNGLKLQEPYVNFMKTIGDTIFAGISSNTIWDNQAGCGLIVSTDGGVSWENWGLNGYFVTSLIKVNNNFFVGTNNYGVFFSSDNGKSWENRNNGIQITEYPDSYPWLNARALVSIGDKIYCGIWDRNYEGNLFVSTDLGSNWVHQKIKTEDESFGATFLDFIDNVLFVGGHSDDMDYPLHYSKDTCNTFILNKNIRAGDLFTKMIKVKKRTFLVSSSPLIYFDDIDSNWIKKNPIEYEDPNIHDVLLSITSLQDTILISTEAGKVYYSSDNGDNWKENSKFPYELSDLNYLVNSHDKYFVAPYYQTGMYSTNSINEKWQNVEIEKINAKVSTMEKAGKSILIGTENFGLFKSTNYGDTWTKISGFENTTIYQIKAIDENTYYLCTSNGLYYTSNSGSTFSMICDQSIGGPVYSFSISGNRIFAGTGNAGYYYSYDNGLNWTKIENAIYSMDGLTIKIFDNIWYTFSKFLGLSVSFDEGETWVNGNYGIFDNMAPNSKTFSDMIKFDGKLYLTTNNMDSFFSQSGLYVSESDGVSWRMNTSNLPFSYGKGYPRALTIFGYDSTLFVSIMDNGTYMSMDYGESWIELNEGLQSKQINKFITNGKYLFVATDNGVFRMELDEIGLGVKEKQAENFATIFPNPATDYITIDMSNYTLKGIVMPQEIVIYDVFGKCVNTSTPSSLRDATPQEGNIRINVSALPTGTYFLRAGSEVWKFMVVR
ncbi:MAG: hypothetical protein A2X64_10910 [Ignavibacteria bacterium GWF2_33_9]|nr:MAG: hypothetical protein A2X64_10910 [Ignavibacteria bacterium GWF2_33_9]